MNSRNQSQNPEATPQQLAFGQSSRAQCSPEEAAAEHWQEVYRLAKKLRHGRKKRGGQAWARKRVQTKQRQNKQQELIPQPPELPEFEFTKPDTKDLAAIREREKRPYRFTDLRLSKPARNQYCFDDGDSEGDAAQAGRAICRHLIAALRIQHAEEQNQQAEIQQS